MKSLLRIFLFAFMGLILAMLVLPFVFKDRIYEELKLYAENNLDAEVEFSDIDLSLFKSFPRLNIQVNDLEIKGIDTYEDTTLLAAEKFIFNISLSPLFNKSIQPEIFYVGLVAPDLNLIVNNEGVANYDIFKSSDEESKFQISLNKYEIINGKVRYYDLFDEISLNVEQLNHIGEGDFSSEEFDLKSNTDGILKFLVFNETQFLKEQEFLHDGILHVNTVENSYALKEHSFQISKLKFLLDCILKVNNNDVGIDLSFHTPSNNFEDLISILPFIRQEVGVSTTGEFILDGKIEGIYNSVTEIYPKINISCNVNQCTAKFDGFDYPIQNINSETQLVSLKNDLSDLRINLRNFNLNILKDRIGGNLLIHNFLNSSTYSGNVEGNINLQNWMKAIPLEDVSNMEGNVNFDLSFIANDEMVRKDKLNELILSGNLTGRNFKLDRPYSLGLSVNDIDIYSDNNITSVNARNLLYGSSQFDINMKLNNLIYFISEDEPLKGGIKITSSNFDLNELVSEDTAVNNNQDNSSFNIGRFDIEGRCDKIIYDDYIFKEIKVIGNFDEQQLNISDLFLKFNDSDLSFKGYLDNVINYVQVDSDLQGNITFKSDKLNLDDFISEDSEGSDVLRIPENINLNVSTTIGALTYSNVPLYNTRGIIEVSDGQLEIRKAKSKLLDGEIELEALYNSKEDLPQFDSKIEMSEIQFSSAYKHLSSFRTIAPIIKHIEGFFNSTLVFSGNFGQDMLPDLSTLNATGYLETLNSSIKNSETIEKLANKLNINELKNVTLENTKNWFELNNGTFTLKERDLKINGLNSKISGQHQIKGKMNYQLDLEIPRALFKSTSAGQIADAGFQYLEKEANKLGFKLGQSENINVKVLFGNTISDPTIKVIPELSSSDIKTEINQKIESKVSSAKDSLKTIVEGKKNEIKDTIQSKVDEEVVKAKEKFKSETDVIIDKAKNKAEESIDSIITNTVSDSLKSKINDALKKKDKEKVEEILKDWDIFKKKKKKKKN